MLTCIFVVRLKFFDSLSFNILPVTFTNLQDISKQIGK